MPWWAALLFVVGLGGALALVAAMLRETPETGAGKVVALFFGWAYALAWFAPWLLVYAAIQFSAAAMQVATPNKVTGPNAGGPRQLPMRTSLTARVGQFCRWPIAN